MPYWLGTLAIAVVQYFVASWILNLAMPGVMQLAADNPKVTLEVFQEMRVRFPQFDVPTLVTWVERFFRLFCRNQWKRERYAPSFHLDDKNLDPKTWCRFPILSGGFERELGELRAYAARL